MSTIGIIMAFDFGLTNIGIAIGQILTCTTQPLGISKSKLGVPDWKHITYIYHEWKPIKLIVGLPLKMDGTEQSITILSKKFAIQLEKKFKVPVEMYDERFTTIEARSQYLQNQRNNQPKKNNPLYINAIAAEIILKSWLNNKLTT